MAHRRGWLIYAVPAAIVFLAFWLLPMVGLAILGMDGRNASSAYVQVLSTPAYWTSLINTAALSLAATATTLLAAIPVARFLAAHQRRPWRGVVMGILTFPSAFPGVVVGFLVILIGGRQGVIAATLGGGHWVFAYGMTGLYLGYLYFSLPRTIGLLTAAVEKIDKSQIEAAQTLGCGAWRCFVDVELPALAGPLGAAGAMAFATSMGAFGTVFTLGTQIDVLPMTIYNEFTNYANIPVAAALSIMLGVATWAMLYAARSWAEGRPGSTAI